LFYGSYPHEEFDSELVSHVEGIARAAEAR